MDTLDLAGTRRWTIGLPIALVAAVGAVLYGFAQAGPTRAAGDAPDTMVPTSSYSALMPEPVKFTAPTRIDYAAIDRRMALLAERPDMVGLAVAIVENGQIRFVKGYGVTTAGTDDPVTPHTVFRWASLSKGVAATTVVKLAEEGRLSLDTPVSQFETTLRLPGGNESRVSVADLLAHRVGIVRNAYDEKLEEGQDPRAIRAMLAALPAYCPPAQCYSYQNIAFDAAAEIVQRVTGQDYGDVVAAQLFAPLGMRNASVGRAGLEGSESWARPHAGRRVLPTKDAYYRVPAAGGVNSSIFDLAKWMRAQMGGAQAVLPESLLKTVHLARVSTEPHRRREGANRGLGDAHYALGWRDYDYVGHRLIGHRGAVDGYRSLILFDPVLKSGVAMLWNSNSSRPVGAQLELMDMLYGQPRKDWLELDGLGGNAGGMNAPLRIAR